MNFNGEIFESPNFCTTLRQAEHAAAEVALNTLSKRGPSQFLAAKILDETGVCKNLLQETAQRVGVSLPVYTTIKGGPGHLPVFKCLVEVAGRVFAGEPAKTKKQAEKNAAMAAWSVIKQWTQPPLITNSEDSTTDEVDGRSNSGALTLYRREERNQTTSQMQAANRRQGGRSRVRVVNVRGKNRLSREGSPAGQFHYGGSSSPASPSGEIGFEDGKFLFNGQANIGNTDSPRIMAGYQRSLPLFDGDSTALSEQDAFTKNRINGNNVGRALPLPWHHQPQIPQQRLSRLSCHSHSDRIELRRPLMEEFDLLRECDDDWLSGGLGVVDNNTPHSQQQQQQPQSASPSDRGRSSLPRRAMFQSQSERFELKPSLLEEMYYNDEEEWWLRGELMQPVAMLERARSGMHREQENGSVVYYDGNRGSSYGGTESVSHVSNDFGNLGSAYNSGFRDANNMPFGGFKETAKQEGSYPRCTGAKISPPFAGFQQSVASPQISYEDVERGSSYTDKNKSYSGDRSSSYSGNNFDIDRGTSLYTNFSVDTPNRFFFNNDGAKSIFSGYANSTRSRGIHDDELGASSSSSVWSHPANLWASNSMATSVAQSLGIRQPTSMAPPVKVRQMVAVCSAPPPRRPAIDSAGSSISNVSTHPYLPNAQPLDHTSSSSDTSACQFFSQLRI